MLGLTFAFLAVLPFCASQCSDFHQCPTIPGVKNFDFKKIAEKAWHLHYIGEPSATNDKVKKLNIYVNKTCVKDELSLNIGSLNEVKLETVSEKNYMPHTTVIYGSLTPNSSDIILRHYTGDYDDERYSIVATDYLNILVAYSCAGENGKNDKSMKPEKARIIILVYTIEGKSVLPKYMRELRERLSDFLGDIRFIKQSWEDCDDDDDDDEDEEDEEDEDEDKK